MRDVTCLCERLGFASDNVEALICLFVLKIRATRNNQYLIASLGPPIAPNGDMNLQSSDHVMQYTIPELHDASGMTDRHAG